MEWFLSDEMQRCFRKKKIVGCRLIFSGQSWLRLVHELEKPKAASANTCPCVLRVRTAFKSRSVIAMNNENEQC